jgi:hypothetical protein
MNHFNTDKCRSLKLAVSVRAMILKCTYQKLERLELRINQIHQSNVNISFDDLNCPSLKECIIHSPRVNSLQVSTLPNLEYLEAQCYSDNLSQQIEFTLANCPKVRRVTLLIEPILIYL